MMTSFLQNNLHNTGQVDAELRKIRAENHALSEELAQCQADKDFVWSLWKRLQVASPDITQAISLVMRREKEKEELKDRKVLEILQKKDDKAFQLQQQIQEQDKELSLLTASKLELQDQVNLLQVEVQQLRGRVEDLQSRGSDLPETSRDTIRQLDRQCLELKQQTSKQSSDVDSLVAEKKELQALYEVTCDKIKNLEKTVEEKGSSMDQLNSQFSEVKKQLDQSQRKLTEGKKEVAAKGKELENVRRELSELWQTHQKTTEHVAQQAGIIKQLQSLQHDTNKVMQNQEDAFSMESASIQNMYQGLKVSEKELRLQLQQYQAHVEEQEKLIVSLNKQLEEKRHEVALQAVLPTEDKNIQAFEMIPDMEYKLQCLQTEVALLKDRLRQKNREVNERAVETSSEIFPASYSLAPRQSRARETRPERQQRLPTPASQQTARCASPHKESDLRLLQQRLAATQAKLETTQSQLHMKSKELEEVRRCHGRRLERLQAIQSNQRLLKKQLHLLEEEHYGKKRRKPKLKRSEPKALQKEDSDAVWNELAYFKNENKNLMVERMNLEEQCDRLSVRVAQDTATIHELQMCLEQEREDLQMALEEQSKQQQELQEEEQHSSSTLELELQQAQRQIHKLRRQLEKTKSTQKELLAEKDRLTEDNRSVRHEVNRLIQQNAQQRMQMTDLRRELHRCQRELKRKKRVKASQRSSVAKQYQKILNSSIQNMSQTFEDFDKEGWEEVSDTEEVTDMTGGDVTGTTDSLGQQITLQAAGLVSTPAKSGPSLRQVESVEDHVRRMNRKNETLVKDAASSPCTRNNTVPLPPVTVRNVALSPIHMDYEDVPTQRTGQRPRPGGYRGRQSAALRQRVAALHKQVGLLRQVRNAATRGQEEQRRAAETLQTDFNLANQRLQSTRLTVQRLTGEVERLRQEKDALEQQLEGQSVDTSLSQRSEQDWSMVNTRLKHATGEVSRQLALIKQLKAENGTQLEQIQELKERVNHQERDLSQKRSLVEDMRVKLKIAQENSHSDADVMQEVEGKLKNLTDTNSRQKTQLESLKQRVAAVTKEKYESEERNIKLTQDLERKSRQMTDLQKKQAELQGTVTALEQAAQRQLHALAGHSEAAIDTARQKLTQASSTIQEYSKFTKVLAHAMINSIRQARALWQQQQYQQLKRKQQQQQQEKQAAVMLESLDPSLKKAQDLACDILNMSQSDVQHLMTCKEEDEEDEIQLPEGGSGSSAEEIKQDKRWVKRWTRLLHSQEFSLPLVEMFMEKVEERVKLAGALAAC